MNADITQSRAVSDIIWREDLYPRIEPDPATIQRYAANIEVLPPIEVNQHNELIDGYHRWTAHKVAKVDTINVTVTQTASDNELLKLACRRNAAFGIILNDASKRKMAIRFYASGTGDSKEEIATTLSVTLRTVSSYLSDIDKQLREERKQHIFDMWLSCHTQEEIAEAVGISIGTVNGETETIFRFGSASKSEKSLAQHADADFETPIYNVWTFAKKTNGVEHFGNSEQRIVDNLLYLYTEPFDIVIDPFAGGGSTIDVCKRRLRRYWCSDRKPTEARRDIRTLDISKELPSLNRRWSEVTLTYLDPPYWRQAAGQYSDDPEDFANMPLEEFTDRLTGVVKRIAEKQSHGVIALLIQPTQWKSDDKQYTDHVTDLVRAVGNKRLVLENRVSCPYSTEQYNAQQVEWAKEHRKLLVITRELIVWRIA